MGEVERKDLFFKWSLFLSLPDPGCGPLWLPTEESATPGAGSERREEDSFDSDSTATLLK